MKRENSNLREETSSRDETKDWGNVRFRRRRSRHDAGSPDENADARFWIGVMLIFAVALAYPWYSYWVNARLLTRDLEMAGREVIRQIDIASEEQNRQSEAAATARREAARRARISTVRVVGTVPGNEGPIAIVRLEQSQLPEAASTICRQSEFMLGFPLAGQLLRVQLTRGGNQPAVDGGHISC